MYNVQQLHNKKFSCKLPDSTLGMNKCIFSGKRLRFFNLEQFPLGMNYALKIASYVFYTKALK